MPKASLLSRLGLDRPELRAWAMYDWAASAMQTTIMVAVFPIYFVKVAGAGLAEGGATQRLAGGPVGDETDDDTCLLCVEEDGCGGKGEYDRPRRATPRTGRRSLHGTGFHGTP